MKIVVCVKQAVDIPSYVEFTADGRDVDPAFMSFEVNEADTYAVEEALRLQDDLADVEVVVVTAGDEGADEALRRCVAMGAHRSVRVVAERPLLHDPIAVARMLAEAVRAESPDFVLCGVQSSDAAQQSTGPALASALGMPCVSVATRVTSTGGPAVRVRREFEGGLAEDVEVTCPVVISVQTGLNSPRYGSFKGMMRAKKTPVELVESTGVQSRTTVRHMSLPSQGGGRNVTMIDGGPEQVAARIVELVREVS